MEFWVLAHVLFGFIIGSFLNVLVLRHGTGRSMEGRSACLSCGHQLAWYELIPVFSWVFQRGRCRSCGSGISAQYPVVEALTGALFAFVAVLALPLGMHVLALGITSILVAIAVYDLRHTIIPDSWVYAFAATALVFGVLSMPAGSVPQEWIVLLGAGPLVAFPLWALWVLSQGAWIGLGDAKLMLGAGWLLGPLSGFMALLGGFVLGAVVSVVVLLPLPMYRRWAAAVMHASPLSRGVAPRTMSTAGWNMKSEVPFGPFLIASIFVVWFLQSHGIPMHDFFIVY